MNNEIHINHITKRYGDVEALRDLSLEIGSGELFGLIGPDGAGKTTLFRILTTLLLADSGTASVCGLDVVKDLKEIGILSFMAVVLVFLSVKRFKIRL